MIVIVVKSLGLHQHQHQHQHHDHDHDHHQSPGALAMLSVDTPDYDNNLKPDSMDEHGLYRLTEKHPDLMI